MTKTFVVRRSRFAVPGSWFGVLGSSFVVLACSAALMAQASGTANWPLHNLDLAGGRFIACNDTMTVALGYARKELNGQPFVRILKSLRR